MSDRFNVIGSADTHLKKLRARVWRKKAQQFA